MNLKRFIIDTGKKTSLFFSNDLQNYYYKYMFLDNAKKYIGKKTYKRDLLFEKESKDYWKKHTGKNVSVLWHSFYSSCNGIKDVRYVPENIYYAYIEPFFNRKEFIRCCDDKCYYTERFPENAVPEGVRRPPLLLRNIDGLFFDDSFNILKLDEAATLLSSVDTGYVIKESITGTGGNRILFVEAGIRENKDKLKLIFEKYGSNFVVEGLISQCSELKALNPTSVNTIRFITFMDENGIHLLSSVLRIGGIDSKTDNFSTGGIACGIDENGILKDVGYDQKFNQYVNVHPNGIVFKGVEIPSYERAKSLVTNLHRRFGHFRIISWDIAIGEDYSPIIIEFNLTPQSIDFHQINNGPLFGYLTDSIIDEVFSK